MNGDSLEHNDCRPPTWEDVEGEAVVNAMLEILVECYRRGTGDPRGCISFSNFAARLSRRTGIDWWGKRRMFFEALRLLNSQRPGCVLTTCIVSSEQLPVAGYFKSAINRGLLPETSGTYEKLAFWLKQYDLAREVCRRLAASGNATDAAPKGVRAPEDCADSSA
jgi:hypothetical protein